MSRLHVFAAASPGEPVLVTEDKQAITRLLAKQEVLFERWIAQFTGRDIAERIPRFEVLAGAM